MYRLNTQETKTSKSPVNSPQLKGKDF